MLNINEIGINAMIHARDHKTPYLIDPWDYLGPKRRKLLDGSWARVNLFSHKRSRGFRCYK